MSRPVQRPVEITQWDQVLTMLDARNDKTLSPSAAARRTSLSPA
jgi:hypothetical protein